MAYCANCGREISNAAVLCPQCGHPGPRAAGPAARWEGLSIASIITSASSFLFLFVPVVPILSSIAGIVLGGMAQRRLAREPQQEGGGLARAGIIVGWVGLILAILAQLFYFSIFWSRVVHPPFSRFDG